MDSITKAVARHRAALLAEQKRASVRLAEAYARAWANLEGDVKTLQDRIRRAHEAGDEVNPEWLRRSLAHQALMRNIERELVELAPTVAGLCSELAQDAVAQAVADAAVLLETAGADGGAFTRLNTRAVTQITGAVNRGPLEALLVARADETAAALKALLEDTAQRSTQEALIEERARTAVTAAKQVLAESVIRGRSPYRTARELQRVITGLTERYALMLVRTEQLRAYREATRLSYKANPAVSRWVWSSRLVVGRTCSYCWAMHGTTHSVERTMATHPSCMCVAAPLVEDVDYGPTGKDAFAALTPDEQKTILGPAGLLAYQAGDLKLADLVKQSTHPQWGRVGHAKSLTDVLGAQKAATYIAAAIKAGRTP